MALPHARVARIAAGALAGALALAGCSLSSDNVSCSGTKCTATLSGDGASAEILGTKVTFAGTKDGRATLGVGDASVSCTQGQSIGAGPLSVTCTKVSDGALEITASLT
ncbi:MAG TPA: hypothetical protein VGN28_08595 [Blastococcus sp.]|jgi:hypothetical protein|nr:hypothetical protein [Blastococcus sp.]